MVPSDSRYDGNDSSSSSSGGFSKTWIFLPSLPWRSFWSSPRIFFSSLPWRSSSLWFLSFIRRNSLLIVPPLLYMFYKIYSLWSLVTVSYVVTGETVSSHEAIIKQLKHGNLKVIPLDTRNQHQCQCIIVFCPITSRAGSDVAAAMAHPAVLQSDKPVFLVLMYHTRDVDYCTAGENCSEKFPRVVSEVHVLFHETQPDFLYYPNNHQAIDTFKKAISTYFHQN